MLGVHHLVKDSVELIGLIVVGDREEIGSLISLRVLVVKTGHGVERLMDVTKVVD